MKPMFLHSWLLVVLVLWSLAWKGWALWRAAKNNQKNWFVALLLVNSAGLLDIAYLIFWQKNGRLWERIIKK